MAVRKKKLGERVGSSLVQLKGDDQRPQVFSLIGGDVLTFDYHFDDIYNQLGRFMCNSEYDENGKMIKRAECCKVFKKRQDRVLIPVIAYEGTKKNYRKMEEAKIKYLSITSYKYNDLCKNLDDAGVDFEDADVDIVLKSEDAARGKISFDVIDNGEGALWRTNKEMKKLVEDALETWEEDIKGSLPNEYSKEEFLRLIEEAKESGAKPEGVEDPDDEEDDIPKKKKNSSDSVKSKKKIEKDLDEELDDEDEEEDETPKKKKKKSVKEQIEEEDFDNEDLEEDETPKKKKKKQVEEEEDLDSEDDEDEEDETPKKKKKKQEIEDEDELDDEDED